MGVTEEGRKLGVRVGTTEELRAKMVEIGAPADVVSDDGQVDIARLDALGLTHRNRKGDHVTIGPRRPAPWYVRWRKRLRNPIRRVLI